MDFTDLVNNSINGVSSYAKAHPVEAGVALVAAFFLLYRRPLTVLMILTLGLLLAGLLYVILEMGSSGVSTKERMIRKQNVPEDVYRATPIQLNAGNFDMQQRPSERRASDGFAFRIKDKHISRR